MSNPSAQSAGDAGPDNNMSALFASLVMQITNMALIFLGHAPNPQTGQTTQDLERARLFIDQLEMLALKTKGNLDKQEESLLNQSLTSLRLAFVEAVEHPRPAPTSAPPSATPTAPPAAAPETPAAQPPPPSPDRAGSESRIKFSKKY
jgi:hypothetical protein